METTGALQLVIPLMLAVFFAKVGRGAGKTLNRSGLHSTAVPPPWCRAPPCPPASLPAGWHDCQPAPTPYRSTPPPFLRPRGVHFTPRVRPHAFTLQIVGDRYGVGIDDTHVRLRGAPVLDEPALDVHQQVGLAPGQPRGAGESRGAFGSRGARRAREGVRARAGRPFDMNPETPSPRRDDLSGRPSRPEFVCPGSFTLAPDSAHFGSWHVGEGAAPRARQPAAAPPACR